jgi:hypothetical protein
VPLARRNQRVDEAPVIFNRCEVAAAAQDQCLFDGFLEMPVLGFNRPVLVGFPAIVTAGIHAVMADEGIISLGDVLALIGGQVAECGREAVGAVVLRHAAQRPEGLLQVLGQRREAFPTEDHADMFLGRVDKAHPAMDRGYLNEA